MRSKTALAAIILAGALVLAACGDAGKKENKEEPGSTEVADKEKAGSSKPDDNTKEFFTGVSWSEEEDEIYAVS